MDARQQQSDELLKQIKKNLTEIENLLKIFQAFEEDYVYRLYHQSFKVFNATEEIKRAKELFKQVAPESLPLNPQFCRIADEGLSKEFDWTETNSKWLTETRPILEAFWQCKYFLEQMQCCGRDLKESPQLLPSSWAAVLYLYNLR